MSISSQPLPNIYTRSLRNIFRRTPIRVGIVLDGYTLPYGQATAVARLRVYDVIEMFAADPHVAVELYLPWRRYDLVIFEKSFTARALALAQALKRRKTKILLDVNVDYFSQETPRVTKFIQQQAYALARLADGIIAPSERLVEELRHRHIHARITYIPEPLSPRYFAQPKLSFAVPPRLVWCGYATKAAELEVLAEQLHWAQQVHGVSLTLISDRDPHLSFASYRFIPYRERTIAADLAQADVFIAPRRFDQAYKYYHTFTKIGLPLAVGLPVIASPMPSYLSAPAVFCATTTEWQAAFEALYSERMDLTTLSQRGREYCRQEFSWERIHTYYQELFQSLTLTTP